METMSEPFHFGRWLAKAISQIGKSRRQFAAMIPASRQSVAGWIRSASPDIQDHKRVQLGVALSIAKERIDWLLDHSRRGTDDEAVRKAIVEADAIMGEITKSQVEHYKKGSRDMFDGMSKLLLEQERVLKESQENTLKNRDLAMGKLELPETWDNNIIIPTLKVLKPIPTWNLAIAAGGWIDVPIGGQLDYDDPKQRAIVEQGLFRICIDGDSMTKDWMPGDCVEFEMFRPDRDVLTIGEDYAIVRSDHMGTFKRLAGMDDDKLVFVAANRRKYPSPMIVARQEIARLAIARHVVMDRRKRG